ncbi:MAG TPA: FAD-dependent oxidoreductase, partial [Actinomycetes bacterium]|nr:FAD-dependent oxidoreductase [Actinomycetes bacterium]
RRLPPSFAAGAAADAATAWARRPRADTFAETLRAGLGPTMCRRFYFPYARKLWGLDPSELAGEQARRRVSAGSPGRLLSRVVRGARRSGGPWFWYPRHGFGTICERLAAAAAEAGAELRYRTAAERVELGPDGATVTLAGGETLRARRVWSTVPLPTLARMTSPAPPPAVLAAAGELEFRAMVLVYLVLDGGRYSPYDAHYLPDPGTPVTRVSEPANYRDGDDPPARTVLCAELPCSRDGELWRAGNDRLAGLVRAALRDRGLPDPGPVRRVAVRRLPNVYPVYRVGYATPFQALDAWAAAQPALLSFGRLGLFVHDNTHHALAMAWAAADALSPDGAFDHAAWAAAREGFTSHVVED